MFTILHPEVMPLIRDLPIGLLPLRFTNDSRPILVVKASKEVLLAARVNLGFKIYVAPVVLAGKQTIGLITAFLDNEDEPLVIYTSLFDEAWVEDLRRMLLRGDLEVYFFDDNNRELLGYVADVQCASATRDFLEGASLLSFDFASARSAHDQMIRWFGLRSSSDDLLAISVTFGESLLPNDILIVDLRPESHSYQGGCPFSSSQLVREEPGAFQERDIVQLLHRVFSPEQIYLTPLRATDREEITDILVLTGSRALFIQAKDSPNTEPVLRNSVHRKKATTEKALTKAISQARGALRYARSMTPMKMIVGGDMVEVELNGLELRALIVVKELFNDEYSVYSPPILSLSKQTKVPCIALDYTELNMYTANLRDEESFFKAFDLVLAHGVKTGEFPRLRLGLIQHE